MEGYDDVLQFISKVGDQNLTYRSFPSDTQSPGQSKWHLLNQVASYKHKASERPSERVVVLSTSATSKPEPALSTSVYDNSGLVDVAASVQSSAEASYLNGAFSQAQSKNNGARGFSHLFKEPQQQETQTKSVAYDSLSALLGRIGS